MYLNKYKSRLVWAADEFYLCADVKVPSERTYEGYIQLENGVGIVRRFIESAKRAKKIIPQRLNKPVEISIVTGKLAYKTILCWVNSIKCENLRINVFAIENSVFGKDITVSGLMCGCDIINTLKGKHIGDVLIVPDVCLRDEKDTFLDDITLYDIENTLDVRVKSLVSSPMAVIKFILSQARV